MCVGGMLSSEDSVREMKIVCVAHRRLQRYNSFLTSFPKHWLFERLENNVYN